MCGLFHISGMHGCSKLLHACLFCCNYLLFVAKKYLSIDTTTINRSAQTSYKHIQHSRDRGERTGTCIVCNWQHNGLHTACRFPGDCRGIPMLQALPRQYPGTSQAIPRRFHCHTTTSYEIGDGSIMVPEW
jgi:hypothetical protein